MSKGSVIGMSEDRERIAKARAKLAGLFTEEDLVECRTALLDIVRDPDSRQRVNAVALIFQIVQEGDVEAQRSNNVKILVLDRADITRLGDMQREANEQRATVVDPRKKIG